VRRARDEPQLGTVKEGIFGRHLTFVPLVGAAVGPDNLQVAATVAACLSGRQRQF
jgi:hypothetical protein